MSFAVELRDSLMRTTSILILACLTTIACSGSSPSDSSSQAKPTDGEHASKPNPATELAAETEPDREAIAAKRAKARAEIAADQAKLQATRTQMLAALNQGRKLVKDGQLEAGIAEYQKLLAIDPHHGPALGELGWAEFKTGKLDDAHGHTLRALSVAVEPDKRGMLLYNLGRIAEQRGQTEAAIGHYQDSLAARPNDTVAARLASLAPDRPAPAVAAETAPTGLRAIVSGALDFASACEQAARDSLCGSGDCELLATPDGDDGWGTLQFDDYGLACWHPAVKTPAGWVVFEAALIAQHGSEVHQDVDALESRIISNDAGEFLLFEYSDHIYERTWDSIDELDEDGRYPADDTTDSEGVILCRRDGAAPRCTVPITTDYEFVGDQGETRAHYSADFELRGDTLVLTNVQREGKLREWVVDAYHLLDAGEHSFEQLAAATGK